MHLILYAIVQFPSVTAQWAQDYIDQMLCRISAVIASAQNKIFCQPDAPMCVKISVVVVLTVTAFLLLFDKD